MYPIFGPISPATTPGIAWWSSFRLICTTNAWGPRSIPCVISRAITTACVDVLPMPPGHHLVAVSVGEWITNCSFSASYVAVVSKPRMYVPCPSSVCA